MRLVFDIEANGLLDTATNMHCIVTKDIDTQEVNQFRPNELVEGVALLTKAEVLIGHNIISYDLPLVKKLYEVDLWSCVKEVWDTLVWSRTLNPLRSYPYGYKGKSLHSIEAWGYRVGRGKPDHDDWSEFSEDMLHRCTEDVEINYLTYLKLLEEIKVNEP